MVGQLPMKGGWWDAPPALWDYNRSNKHCQSPQQDQKFHAPTTTEHKYDKTRNENWPLTGIELGSSRLVINGDNHYTIFSCY